MAEKWKWLGLQGQHRDQWLVEGYEGTAPPRIKQLDNRTFSCYRDGKYLGSEKTLEEAKARCVTNKVSEKNRVMKLWEEKHPDELPPGLQMTPAERALYWHHHPPQAARAGGVGKAAMAKARPDEDPATAALRAQVAADAGKRRGAKVRAITSREGAEEVPSGVIRVKPGAAIPKKPGSSAHGRWTVLWKHDGKTVAAYAAAKGNMTTLANAMSKGLVTVEKKA